MTQVNYALSPDITLAYDANNRLTNMVDASGTTKFSYTAFGTLLSEDGPWENDTVSYTYDNARRRQQMSLQQMNASSWVQTYAYDQLGRMTNTTSPAGPFGYAYISRLTDAYRGDNETPDDPTAGSRVERLMLPNGAYITNTYDNVVRLTETALLTSKITNRHSYVYNLAHQRTRHTRTAGDYVDYGYDDIGQLKTAIGKEPTGSTNRFNEQFGYRYDKAGNLEYRTNHTLVQSFGVNNLNQLTNQSRTGRMTVAGNTFGPATSVTVNTTNAIRYADHTFVSTNHTLVNGSNTFTAVAQDSLGRADTNVSTAYLPENSVFVHDSNGNMLFDGQKAFEWDDENQLIRITATNAWKSEFTYDGKMRRRIRKEYTWRNSAWALTDEVRYVYHGNLEIQLRDANNLPTLTLTRGKDLSGSLEGAGGIGGLLARTDHSTLNTQPSAAHAYYHADGNGNITILVNTQQVAVAKYLYDPFGDTLAANGLLADANLYGFSSKEFDRKSGLIYYRFRYYHPNRQRWMNRDPIQERGGLNLYRVVQNDPLGTVDPWGLFDPGSVKIKPKPKPKPGAAFLCEAAFKGGMAAGALLGEVTGWSDKIADWLTPPDPGSAPLPCPPPKPKPEPCSLEQDRKEGCDTAYANCMSSPDVPDYELCEKAYLSCKANPDLDQVFPHGETVKPDGTIIPKP